MSTSHEFEALVVFCEGSHDVAFVDFILKSCLDFKKQEWKFSQYPSPLNKIFSRSVVKHAALDLDLDMAHKFFLPDRVLSKNNKMVMLFNSGGKSKIKEITTLISSLPKPQDPNSQDYEGDFSYETSNVIKKLRYLFLYDADDIGLAKTCEKCYEDFCLIDEIDWLCPDWKFYPEYPCAAINGNIEKSIYVWGETHEYGTLEDLLYPMLSSHQKNSTIFDKSSKNIDDMFLWKVNDENKKTAVAEVAKRKKAIITLAGQRDKPGSPMSLIIKESKIMRDVVLEDDENVMRFIGFFNHFFLS